ncbi:flippase [Nitrococcus mobilis]|nr:flippase [Nitrococcus mobilis]
MANHARAPTGQAGQATLQMRPQQLIQGIRADLRRDTERGRLVRSAAMTAALKIGATLLAFTASLLYARALGPHDYGLYAYVIAWTAVLGIPASLGLPAYLIREGARRPESLKWLLHWANRRVIGAGLLAAAALASAVFIPAAAGARWLFVIAAPLPLLGNLAAIRVSLLRVQGAFFHSQWPQLLLAPASMLAVLLALWFWQGRLTATDLTVVMTLSALAPLVINELQLHRIRGFSSKVAPTATTLRQALPFMWLGMLYLVNSRVDLIMLGALQGAQASGVYSVATRAADLVTFFLIAANTVIVPRIAHLYQQGEHAKLQRLISGAVSRVFLLTLPVALVFAVFARPLIEFLYGPAYAPGAIALQILALAQLFNVFAGPTGNILNMTGHERLSMTGVGISVAVNVTLNALLIPRFGVEGAAIATGASLAAWNILLWYWIRNRLGLRPSVLYQ